VTGNRQTDGAGPSAAQGARRKLGFFLVTSGIVLLASLLTVTMALGRGDQDTDASSPAAQVLLNPTGTPHPVATVAGVTQTPFATAATTLTPATEAPSQQPTPTATPQPTASSATASPAVGDPATATPFSSTPQPAGTLAPAAAALAGSIESQYGVRIIVDGQDWGQDRDAQMRNIGAVGDALAGVPANVRSAINANGPLTYLSNHGGATEASWQPYGDRETNYYSNEDVVSGKHVAANEIVLQPGSTTQTITHEMMHAYQMRDIAPGQYVMALLTPEMKSFMAATGWTQTVSDDELRASAGKDWTAINVMFTYDGHSLFYNNEFGDRVSLYAPNPIEAYAEAGGLYYGHSAHTTLPDWPDYFGWFAANVG